MSVEILRSINSWCGRKWIMPWTHSTFRKSNGQHRNQTGRRTDSCRVRLGRGWRSCDWVQSVESLPYWAEEVGLRSTGHVKPFETLEEVPFGCFAVLEREPWALHIVGKWCSTATLPALVFLFLFSFSLFFLLAGCPELIIVLIPHFEWHCLSDWTRNRWDFNLGTRLVQTRKRRKGSRDKRGWLLVWY